MSGLFSQFYVLSQRGDVLLFRDFRGDLVKATTQIFFRRVRTPPPGELADVPIFDGVQYMHIVESGLFFVFTTRANVSPSLALALLHRITEVIRDFCGVLSEEALRQNFILVYEIVDEILDFGYPQSSAVEELKAFVRSPPILVDTDTRSELLTTLTAARTTSSKTANQSVAVDRRNAADEIFVDLLETLTVELGADGSILQREIEGAIVVKSFIKGGPKVKLGLNEDLRVGRTDHGGSCVLDSATFHPCVTFTEWDMDRTLTFHPPEGEFHLLRYRTKDPFAPPFRMYVHVEEPGEHQIDVFLKISADFTSPNFGNRVIISCHLPHATASCSCETSDSEHTTEWHKDEQLLLWGVRKWMGGSDAHVRVKLNLESGSKGPARREIGPVTLRCEIPMFVCSNVQIRYLKVFANEKLITPHRWVRSITRAESYVAHVDPDASHAPSYW